MSRRQAEAMVERGEVYVNGRRVQSPAEKVDPNTAQVRVGKINVQADGIEGHGRMPEMLPRLFLAYKLPGEIVTRTDPEGRETLFDRLDAMSLPKGLKSVGRLDLPSEGLLLLTDDGGFSRYLEHPAARIRRTYRVRVFGTVTAWKLRQLRRGLQIGKERLRPMDVTVEAGNRRPHSAARSQQPSPRHGKRASGPNSRSGTASVRGGAHGNETPHSASGQDSGLLAPRGNVWLRIQLSEGRNREIRRAMSACGLHVGRLIRVGFGPYRLSEVSRGGAVEVPVPPKVWRRAKGWLEGGETAESLRAPGAGGIAGRVTAVTAPATAPSPHGNRPTNETLEGSDGSDAAWGPTPGSRPESDDGTSDGSAAAGSDAEAVENEGNASEEEDDEAWAELALATLSELKAEQQSRMQRPNSSVPSASDDRA